MKHQDYKHLAEHQFGIDTSRMLADELTPYKDRISEMAQRYNTSCYYVQRKITYITFRNFGEGHDSDLEHTIDVVGRWLRIRGEEWLKILIIF